MGEAEAHTCLNCRKAQGRTRKGRSVSVQLDRADIGEGRNVRPAGKAQAGAERPEELGLPGQGTSPGRRPSLPVKAGVGGAGKRRVPASQPPPAHRRCQGQGPGLPGWLPAAPQADRKPQGEGMLRPDCFTPRHPGIRSLPQEHPRSLSGLRHGETKGTHSTAT